MSSTAPPSRPVYSPLQPSANSSENSSAFQSYTSTTHLAAPTPASSAPVPSPAAPSQSQNFYGSLNVQPQMQQGQPPMPPMQRYRSFEYQPNRDGAGRTAGETQNFLNQAALLAEAAKRAQVHCVMRDFDDMEL